MKFTLYNHKAPADHKFQNVVLDAQAQPDTFRRMVFKACGDGMNAAFTAKAIASDAALRALEPGQSLRLTTQWLDHALTAREVDVTLTRIEG